ncbi:MAG: 2-amino-4-hydroxy-6-hydroxymethyldihydropteridine diphosphokinase [Planctomycetota bacterium]
MTDHFAYIGLGCNVGDCRKNLRQALGNLEAHPSVSSVDVSSFYETKPLTCRVGCAHAETFLNAVAKVKTTLSYRILFEFLQKIEQDMGRQRNKPWGPRTIDLDLLLYDDTVVNEADLTIPHPQLHLRSFVLKGLCELAPDALHPVLGHTMCEIAGRINGGDYRLDANRSQLISITGNVCVGKSTLAARLARRLDATFIPEKFDENPFLPEVYAGKAELALDSELFFLNSRAVQLRSENLFTPHRYVSDYIFEQALIYASFWLNENDLAAYRKHYESASKEVEAPTLIIHMHDSLENCIQRIHQRNRPYEQQIETPFLEHLACGYDTLYTDYTVCPVMRIAPDQCWTAGQVDRIADEAQYYIAKAQE